ncbi:conserved hypothetical protein [Rubrivivax sp. A210]|uniref:PhaM family polyhydroxyalkanoate granule multifunctional regulatory protein n=1 Tax=Rubrivivax sp. A210 TaxID=2772301 RepID=UPI0019195505|nr:PhaM family polyhydroxyalkanoate granule multifunctional regulatory protein [Rubrivivax sp. A210]CAD5370323.1 conserved hypothetical protein [Rubrivivax sp. A210]
MAGAGDLARMVPGFDFLQGLLKNAGAGMPNIGQWVAPTLDPADLDKRISELRTVQFWLEQNAKLIGTTIQALEVQRMTLATLQSMNMPLADLGEALKIKVPAPTPAAPPRPAPAPAPAAAQPAPAPAPADKAPAPPAVDPMQWWGALTQQFTELAAKAVKETTDGAATLAAAAAKKMPAAVAKAAAAPAAAKAGGPAAEAVAAARKTVAKKAAPRKAATPRKTGG